MNAHNICSGIYFVCSIDFNQFYSLAVFKDLEQRDTAFGVGCSTDLKSSIHSAKIPANQYQINDADLNTPSSDYLNHFFFLFSFLLNRNRIN